MTVETDTTHARTANTTDTRLMTRIIDRYARYVRYVGYDRRRRV
jgi:hypothetical protein